jgi:uncharacterized protein (UPF0371 family)
MLTKIMGKSPYKSPTDMGVNMAGDCIIDDAVVKEASKQEVIRRYLATLTDNKKGRAEKETIYKIEALMRKIGVSVNDRAVVEPALEKEALTGAPACAMQLPDGTIVTGKTGNLLGACSAVLLNALKVLGNIDDSVDIISSSVIEPIQKLKTEHMGSVNPRLHTDEILLSLAVSAVTNPIAKVAMEQLGKLKGAELHSTVILSHVDEKTFKKLGVNVTSEPKKQNKSLYNA